MFVDNNIVHEINSIPVHGSLHPSQVEVREQSTNLPGESSRPPQTNEPDKPNLIVAVNRLVPHMSIDSLTCLNKVFIIPFRRIHPSKDKVSSFSRHLKK